MTMIVKDILGIGCARLADAGVMDPKIDAERLYCHMRRIETGKLFMEWPATLEDELCERYFDLLDIRATGMPLQYILGTQEFMGFSFKVNRNVLIPRQDTETLAEEAVVILAGEREEAGIIKRKKWKVLDLCSGSGAIAVSLAKICRNAEFTAADLSKEACLVAKENSEALGTSKNVRIVTGDLFAPFKRKLGNVRFDMIISNPPYVKTDVLPHLQREVKDFEPLLALDGGADGLEFYKRILFEAPEYLKKEGVLLLEIGHDQADEVVSLLDLTGKYKEVRVLRDLAGRNRVVCAVYQK